MNAIVATVDGTKVETPSATPECAVTPHQEGADFAVEPKLTYASVMALAGLPAPPPETDAALAAEIAADLAVNGKPRERAYLQVLLDIAEGRRQRPRSHMGTSRNLIGMLAGLSLNVRQMDPGIAALDRKYNARLPGRGVNMHVPRRGGAIAPRRTLMDVCEDFAMLVIEQDGKFPAFAPGSSELSIQQCAEMMDEPFSRFSGKPVAYLRKVARIVGVADIPSKYTKEQREAYLAKVIGWVDRRMAAGLPLPCQKLNYTLIDHAQIMAANGPGPDISLHKAYLAKVAEARALLTPTPDGAVVDGPATFGALRAAIRIWMADGTAPDWANISATLTKARKAFDADEEDRLPDAFYGARDEFVSRVTEGRGLTGKSLRNLQRWAEAIHGDVDRYVKMGGLPVPMWEALSILVRRSGKTQREISEGSGIPEKTLWKLMAGPEPMLASTVDLLPRLEKVLDATEGCLVARVGDVLRSLRDGRGCDEFRALPWRLRRLFPDGAESWDGVRVTEHAAELRKKALGQNLRFSAIARNAQTMPPRPALSEEMPIVDEYRKMKGHMVSPMPTDAKRHPKSRWEGPGTIDIMDKYVEDFALFALTPISLGGLGRSPEQVSMVLLLNWRNVAMWLNARAGRHAELVHLGKPLGVAISDWDLAFVGKIIGWMGSRYGWITQRPDVFAAQLVADETPLGEPTNLRKLMLGKRKAKAEVVALADEFCSFAGEAVLPAALVERARTGWRHLCIDVCDELAHLSEVFQRFKTRKRKVMEPISAIVKSTTEVPLEWMSRGVRRAIAALPDPRKLYRHATAVRDILVMILLITTALRSKNIRELRFFYDTEEACDDYGGVVTYTSDGIDVVIPWDQFKNRTSEELFGPFGDKKDYDRRIGDWLGLVPLFEYYVAKCLPVLRKTLSASAGRNPVRKPRKNRGGKSLAELTNPDGVSPLHRLPDTAETENLLFPRGYRMLMDAVSLRDLVSDWTLRFIVLDEATGRPVPGLAAFGPHAVRDVVATHIVMTSDDPARFEIAADLLQTSVEMVKTRYSHREVQARLAKSDKFYVAVNENFVLPKFAMAA